ncbi:uncharacterized protein F4812DRAFT_446631 [Daldinia caldariorum]|uniref:uncharacterized protein n=1 Tax=Daldinia caldariorum TaxID=326644 RepID=UPI0020087DA0|nr:uncharacterized protein F4812DRAFT_446631 [Daldinia caldariorum]KAI1463353.1 hypothetical protein F4812DRAFT_446631 [Daldinia caldariorum]
MRFITNLLIIACAAPPTLALDDSRPNENVILADCTGSQNSSQLSSEVAYFRNSPNESPGGIAPVTDGQHRDWADNTTSAYFTDTGTTFKAVLGKRGNAGDYAGVGNNGYGNFSCWQMDSPYLYSHDDKNCFVAYECNHLTSPVPIPSASPPAATMSSSSTATPIPESGLSVGAIVGISIGSAAGAILITAVAAFLIYRRWRLKKQGQAATNPQDPRLETGGPGTPKGPPLVNTIWQGPGVRELEAPQVYHELHHVDRPVEIQSTLIRSELDGSTSRGELHSHDLPPRYEFGNPISPGAYGNQKGPIYHDNRVEG